jgi:hypothetical protein
MRLREKFWCLALWALLGCDEGLGRLACAPDGGACEAPGPFMRELLPIRFQNVLTSGAGDLPVQWRVPSECAAPCTRPIELAAAEADGVWTLARAGEQPVVVRIDADGTRSSQPILPPDSTLTLGRVALGQDRQGRAQVRVQWQRASGVADSDFIELLGAGGANTEVVLRVRTRQPLPLGTVATSRGFLLFDGAEGGSSVRLVDGAGNPLWERNTFPSFAAYAGSSALEVEGRYVLGASDGPPRPQFGALVLDEDGRPIRFGVPGDAVWRDSKVLPWGGGFVLAASSDLLLTGVAGVGDGNVDVVLFPSFFVDPQADLIDVTGFRLKRNCANALTMNGIAVDQQGTLYVSSVAGTADAPRGLLCRLPSTGTPRCFQAEPNTLIGALAVSPTGAVYAALGRAPPQVPGVPLDPPLSTDTEIARIELPRD